MPIVHLDKRTGIEAIHGRIGEFIFYTRNGKQCVRRRSVKTSSGDFRGASSQSNGKSGLRLEGSLPVILESLSRQSRAILESDANY